jgi:AcrR family transcriptional regulator
VPKVSQEHLDARRRQILDGAQRCFARHGYVGATVARLEAEIGLSRSAIFNYYPSKLDLFVALAADANRRYAGLMSDEGMDAALRAIVAEDPELIAMIIEVESHLRHDPEFVRKLDAIYEEHQPGLLAAFEARQRDGTYRDDVPALDLGRFASMILNGVALRRAVGDPTDIEVTISLLNDALAPRE